MERFLLAIMARRPEILRRACLRTPLSNSCSFSFYFVLLATMARRQPSHGRMACSSIQNSYDK
jgi:hypothetical protein